MRTGMSRLRRRQSWAMFVMVLALCDAWSVGMVAQSGTVAVSGTVTVPSPFRDRRTEPDVEIVLVSAAGERRAVTSDGRGAFTIPGVPPGRYTLRVDQPQFAAFRQEIVVEAAAPPPITINLEFKTRENTPDFVGVRDRWRIDFPEWQRYAPDYPGEYPYVQGRGLDPYDQNVLKGDLPIAGQNIFLVLGLTSETPVEFRTLPTPSGVSAEEPGSEEFFGGYEQ